MNTFEIEAVSIGEVFNAEIALRSENVSFWATPAVIHIFPNSTVEAFENSILAKTARTGASFLQRMRANFSM